MVSDPRFLADEAFAEQFLELLELSDEECERRLQQLARRDASMAAELSSLILASRRAPERLEKIDPTMAASLLLADEHNQAPDRVGSFQILSELGRGGTGVVYLASRQGDGFEQKVAIKLIKRGMDSALVLGRFREERRILASLHHPNIAALIDGGMLENGQPWFALEYVEGQPLTEWCQSHDCTVDRRLELFDQVCAAVQHAHTRLIIHRDIKPSNVLVTGQGTVKLLDFGIAKILSDENEVGPMTRAGLRAMTPEYAAPEQIRMESVSTATDVHALGVLLFELLTGEHPYLGLAGSRDQLIQAICDTSPGLPSDRIDEPLSGPDGRSSSRQLRQLRRRLRGDLDTIVLKAMAKEPTRRYATVQALADDLERFRSGLPIRARRDSALYRTRRFVGRHRLGVAATTLVLITLLLGVFAVLQQARQTTIQAVRAERSLEFLTDLFQRGDPRLAQPLDTIDDLLEAGSERALEAFSDDPILQGSVLLRLAEVRLGRAEFEQAAELADRALALFQARLQVPDRRLADALRVAGASRYTRGQSAESEPLMREAAEQYRALGDHAREAEVLSAVAGILRQSEGYEAAVEFQRNVVARLVAAVGPDHPALSSARYALGVFAIDAGDYTLAEQELHQALSLAERRGPDGEIEMADISLMLASLLDRMGRSAEAEPRFEQAIASYQSLLGDDAGPVASARFTLGLFHLGQQDQEAAERQFRRVLDSRSASPLSRAHSMRYLGIALTRQQRFDEALRWLEQAQTAYRAIGGVSNQEQAWRAQADWGHVQVLVGRSDRALAALNEAVAGIESIRSGQAYVLIQPLSYQALALDHSGQPEAARRVVNRALAMAVSLLGEDHRLVAELRERHWDLLPES